MLGKCYIKLKDLIRTLNIIILGIVLPGVMQDRTLNSILF